MREIKEIHIHCTASDISYHDQHAEKYLNEWHVKEKGWKDIAYNYSIGKYSNLLIFRPIENCPASEPGRNKNAIAIVLHGNKIFTQKQFDTLHVLVKQLLYFFKLSVKDVYGHYEIDKDQVKTCPNFDMNKIRSRLSEDLLS